MARHPFCNKNHLITGIVALQLISWATSLSLFVGGMILFSLEEDPIPQDKKPFGETPISQNKLWSFNMILVGMGMSVFMVLLQCVYIYPCVSVNVSIKISHADSYSSMNTLQEEIKVFN